MRLSRRRAQRREDAVSARGTSCPTASRRPRSGDSSHAKGLPDAVTATWPKATVQTCVIHLTRASLRLSSSRDHPKLVPALKAIYTAPTEAAAEQALDLFAASELGERYPAIVRT
ncbi:transposase [Streptomyces goshikiensis]|uniref:transposase n=1 Tax=Streptomyces goshikiensis TaxID=1942 RepID=UPI0036748801